MNISVQNGHPDWGDFNGATGFTPVIDPVPPTKQLYDLETDPGEFENLADQYPEMAGLFEQMLIESHPGRNESISPDLANVADPELIERLKSLGYLQ